ncbi:MAG: cupin domain-containing protein [Elsteraceae bacterium]
MSADVTDAVRVLRFDTGWRPDPAAPTATREHYATADGAFKSGLWASKPGKAEVHYQKDELCALLEGKVRLTDAAGHVETYVAGDVFLIPAGFKGLWETLEPTRKIYALHKPAQS